MSAWIANAIARVYFVWFQMSSALSRKGTECCRRTWKPHSTTFRTCNDQKKMPTYTHTRTRLGTLPTMIMMMMLPALPGDAHAGRPLWPHITPHISNHNNYLLWMTEHLSSCTSKMQTDFPNVYLYMYLFWGISQLANRGFAVFCIMIHVISGPIK